MTDYNSRPDLIGGMGDHGAPYDSGECTCHEYNCDEVVGEFGESGGEEVEIFEDGRHYTVYMCELHAAKNQQERLNDNG